MHVCTPARSRNRDGSRKEQHVKYGILIMALLLCATMVHAQGSATGPWHPGTVSPPTGGATTSNLAAYADATGTLLIDSGVSIDSLVTGVLAYVNIPSPTNWLYWDGTTLSGCVTNLGTDASQLTNFAGLLVDGTINMGTNNLDNVALLNFIAGGTQDWTNIHLNIEDGHTENEPATVGQLNDLISNLGDLELFGDTNAHPVLADVASLARAQPAEQWGVTNTLSDGTNWLGYYFLTNATALVRAGTYNGVFYADLEGGNKVAQGVLQLLVRDDGGVTNVLSTSALSDSIVPGINRYVMFCHESTNITGTALYLGVRYGLVQTGGGGNCVVATYGGTPYGSHLDTPGVGAVEGYVLKAGDTWEGTMDANGSAILNILNAVNDEDVPSYGQARDFSTVTNITWDLHDALGQGSSATSATDIIVYTANPTNDTTAAADITIRGGASRSTTLGYQGGTISLIAGGGGNTRTDAGDIVLEAGSLGPATLSSPEAGDIEISAGNAPAGKTAGDIYLWAGTNENDDVIQDIFFRGHFTPMRHNQFDIGASGNALSNIWGTTFHADAIDLRGDILPDASNVYDIGSAAFPLAELHVADLYVHTNTLYFNTSVVTEITVQSWNDTSLGTVPDLTADVAALDARASRDEVNIHLNAFRIAVNGSLSVQGLADGMVDEFEDETGVWTNLSTNATYDADLNHYTLESIAANPGDEYTNNLATWFLMDDNAATTNVIDSSTNNTAAYLYLTPGSTQDGETDGHFTDHGLYSRAFSNGAYVGSGPPYSDCVWFNQTEATRFTNLWAISVWFKTSFTNQENTRIFCIYDSDSDVQGTAKICAIMGREPSINRDDQLNLECDQDDGDTDNSGWVGGSLNRGTWNHLVMTVSNLEVDAYINSTNVWQKNLDKAWEMPMSPSVPYVIGGSHVGGSLGRDGFQGEIDDFRIWNGRNLSPQEVTQLYNSGAGTTNPAIGATPASDGVLLGTNVVALQSPDVIRLTLLQEDVDAVTPDVDIVASVSRNLGVNWYPCPLTVSGDYTDSVRILSGDTSSITNGPAGTNIMYRIEALNEKSFILHGAADLWD